MPIRDTDNKRFPKYCYFPGSPEVSHVDSVVSEGGTGYKCMHFGLVDACIVSVNCTDAQHDQLNAISDTLRFPLDLDNNITTNAIDSARPFLEFIGFPADWINTTLTYKQVLRRLVKFCMISQEFKGRFLGRLVGLDETLDTLVSELSVNKINRFKVIYDNRGLTYPAGTDTLRDVLNKLVENYVSNKGISLRDVNLGGFVV